jgi:cob(I)alamin adenosyltransferase
MKIYTKTGDNGTTSLIGGTRVSKAHLRIETYGTVDELNSWLGMIQSDTRQQEIILQLRSIQNLLFSIGSLLAADPDAQPMKLPGIEETDIQQLEQAMDTMDMVLKPLQNFILPGGHSANAKAHVARCVCRRAERLAVALDQLSPVDPKILKYLNRLSDFLFVLARYFSHLENADEIPWIATKSDTKD